MPLHAGTRLGAYEILSHLGTGGMGEVYRAKDSKLGRDVAIKVLPEAVAQDAERLARFEREARTLASLNHPNIVTIFSVEESGGTRFLAMELIEGESLDAIIEAGGLPLSRFLEISVPLADAVSAAHERGIVHRDLKPGNVMVTGEGRVKVLDFGLAKLGGPESDPNLSSSPTGSRADLTGEGQVFGTVAYMSPEQARGAVVDARSDVFSLGVVLYQMLTGERPFTGTTAVDMISSILRDKPPSVTDLRADLPPHLARVLRRCLEKNPRDRYQTSRDVYNELKELRAESSSASSAPSARAAARPVSADSESGRALRLDSGRTPSQAFWIAVLPFTHSGADQELDSFAGGLTEDINAGLAKFPYLSVISRNATLRLKAQPSDARVGEQLGARYVVEGGIRRGASAIRVSVQLVDTQTGAHLWAETYNRDLKGSDIFAVQDDITGRVVATVADSYGVLVRSMTAMIQQKADEDLAPSEWLFQYFAYRQQLSPPAHTAMKDRLERAVKRDAGQADLWACLAQVYTDEYAFGFRTDATSLDRALAAARRAVELDRANQLGMVSLAQAYFFRQDLAAFRPAADQAMALNRLNTDALGILGLLIVHTGEFERGAAIVRRAMELNPNHAGWFHFGPIWEHFHRGEYDRALEHAMQVNMPSLFWQPLVIAAISGQLDRRAEAAAAVRDLLALDPGFAAHARRDIEVWHFASGLLEPVLEGVRKGGLTVPETGGARDEGFRVAVLPFKYSGNVAELAALAEGLTEGIVTGLSRFSYVRVIAGSSTSSAPAEAADVRAAGKALGARYVMEGSVRQAGTRLRLAVQVVDATTGAHLWAENYERRFSPETLFELQDDLVSQIVSTVADSNGVLPRSMSEVVRSRDSEQLSPYEAVLRSFAYGQRVTPEELAGARSALESAVSKAPAYADAWAMLAWLHIQDYAQGFNLQADSLASGFTAAQRAVEAEPSNPLAHSSLAQALFFQREFQSFRNAAERAVSLNPMDGNTIAFLGELLTYAGEWERGLALSQRAKQLNSNHPGWYWYADFYDAYRRGDYRGALGFARKVNLPGQWFSHAATAAAFGQLGERDAAAKAARDLLRVRPDFTATARADIEKWWEPEYVESMIDGWRKAGLEIAGETKTALHVLDPSRSPTPASGAARADEGFWVAVLPFKHRGTEPGLEALAEGLTEDIGTGLSRFSYLRVIARSSTSRHANESVDVRTAGKELGARYVMEGNLRQAGGKLRLAVQLVDAVSGAHLWAENYERTFTPEAVFELQDELVPRIVSTVADIHGVLPRSMTEAVRSRPPDQLSPYEAVLRSFSYFERVSAEELTAARSALELAVRKAPGYADAWAMLALLCAQEYGQGYSLLADSLAVGSIAARRAVEAGPSNHLAHSSLAQVLFLQKEFQAFRNAAARAAALNPMDGATVALMGILSAYAGDWERGCAMAEGAMRLNPHFPGWYRLATIVNAYRTRDYRAAVDAALKIQMPGYFWTPVLCAAAYGQLGEREAARKALEELLAIRPEFGRAAREEFGKWHEPELVEHFVEGLRKAGLEIAAEGESKTSAGELARPSAHVSGAVRADEGFWVAVLPFRYSSGNADLAALAEGLSEDVVAGLSRFSYLRVITSGSTQRYAADAPDLRVVGEELGARYVMNGSLRQAGQRLRVAVQLVDASTGLQLWAETYERPLRADSVFELQDDLVSRIVSTVGDPHGILPYNMSESLRSKDPAQLSPYEAVLRSFGFGYRSTPEEHAAVRDGLERAVQQAPGNADARAMLSLLYTHEYAHEFNLRPDPLGRALQAARRAADTAPSSALAYDALAWAMFFRKDFQAFRAAAEQAIALNPLNSPALAGLGCMTAYAGDWERGCALVERALQLNPRHPGWYWFPLFVNAYRKRDYRGAVNFALKLNLPEFFAMHEALAAAYGQLGEVEQAGKAVRDLLRLKPDYAVTGRARLEKWFDPELVAHWIDGLRKAGLDMRRSPAR